MPLIVFYPKGIHDKGGVRMQYNHVIDVLPTTVELTGTTIPDTINGYPQMPIQGISFAYSINQPDAPSKHTVQYYELHGGRAMYKDGWKAEAYHPKTYKLRPESGPDTRDINFRAPLDYNEDQWELYNLNNDWTETTNLAAKYPEKLKELKALFGQEAIKNHVYPLKDFHEGTPKDRVKPQTVLYGQSSSRFPVPIGKLPVKITANIEITNTNNEGIIFAHGDLFGGNVLYIKNGLVHFVMNKAQKEVSLQASAPLATGKHTIRVEFLTDKVRLLADEQELAVMPTNAAKGLLGNTAYSVGISVGKSMNSPVSKSYSGPFPFTGKISTVVIEQQGK
ncbi:hypothetical protein FW774_11505 [Pedobacter sp. BS3]|uniref:hypothetical protein n=1 Tax=Pedobacter sp. BS3 TaxID=2567937 RepID=UPI0011EFA6BF|nr:hypothetical protein [Pedobacter sp. BS3]TZF84062.1 hypothetical protein FW774_11505 [Pedobacter sp. BS3]